MNIISIDVESNGLYGKPFAIGAIVFNSSNGKVEEKAVWRCPIEGSVNPWVEENVIPKMYDIGKTHESLDKMLASFASWWLERKDDATALWHMGHVVEVGLFRLLVERGFIGEFDSPYLPIEVSMLRRCGEVVGDSVDKYVERGDLILPPWVEIMSTHNPLYDAFVAGGVYFLQEQKVIKSGEEEEVNALLRRDGNNIFLTLEEGLPSKKPITIKGEIKEVRGVDYTSQYAFIRYKLSFQEASWEVKI